MVAPILWNKLEEPVDGVVESEIGPNGTIVGAPEFQNAKFNKGVISPTADGNGVLFDNVTGFRLAKTTIEFWFKTPWDVTNGRAADDSYNFSIGFWDDTTTAWGGITIVYTYGGQYAPAFWDTAGNWYPFNAGSWLANTDHHAAFVFDKDGIDGSLNTFRYYLDGVLTAYSNTAYVTTGITDNVKISVCGFIIGALQFGEHANLIHDNLKVYDYAKVDFSDRFWESGSPPRMVNINGEWKAAAAMKININDEWKDISALKVNVNNTWKSG